MNSYTPSEFRESTGDEIEGHLPAAAVMKRVIGSGEGGDIKVLTAYASVTDAELVDMEDGDAGAPIYVRTSKSQAEEVTYTGSPTIATDSYGKTAYSYSGTASGLMNVKTNAENKDYSSAYTVTYKVSSATQYKSALYSKDSNGNYYENRQTFYTGYKKSTLTVTGTDTGSGSATLVFTPKSKNWSSGVITVKPYSPETVVAKKIKQGKLTQATTRDLDWSYYTYLPSAAEEESKTILAKIDVN